MKIKIENIKKFDYLVGFGKVDSVQFFYAQQAVFERTSDKNKMSITGTDYARLVEEQQEQLYKGVVDKVVVNSGANIKTFFSNDEVEVYRLFSEAA